MIEIVVPSTPAPAEDSAEAIKACMESYLREQLTPAMLDAMRLELQVILHRAGVRDLVVETEISLRRYDEVAVAFRDQDGKALEPHELQAVLAEADARRRR